MSYVGGLFELSNWLWLAFWILWLVWGWVTTRRRRVVTRRGFTLPILIIVLAALFLRHRFLSRFVLPLWPGHPAAVTAGFLLQLAGLAFTLWARYYLGSFWSGSVAVREGHMVVDVGPYRLVRHPIYSGILLAVLGSFLMEGSPFWLAVLVLGTAALWWKAWSEERLLTAELGEEYVAYRQRTHMLIPWLL